MEDTIYNAKVKTDVKDRKILVLLSENSRMPVSEIAKKVGLSRDTVAYRIGRLEKLGVIMRFFPDIDFMKLGYIQFRVVMLVDESDQEKYAEFIETLENHPNTRNVIEYSDRWDVEWSLIAKNILEFDEIVTNVSSPFSDIILDRIRLLGFGTYHSQLFPSEFCGDMELPQPQKKTIAYKPDKKDFAIIKILCGDARTSTYDIGKSIGMSPDAVAIRIKKLVDADVILKFTILVNFSLLGYNRYTFVAQIKMLDKQTNAKMKAFVRDHPYIIRAVRTLGTWDLIMYIIASHPKDFHRTIKDIKKEFGSVLRRYDMWVAYKEHIYYTVPKVLFEE